MSLEESIKAVGGIRFAFLSPGEIRKYSVAEITAPETYDEDGMSVQGGLMDNRLGTLEPGQKCATCGNTAPKCPGHFGHVELAEPVIHIAFVDEVHKLLISTCRACGRLLLSEEDIAEYRKRLDERASSSPMLIEIISREILLKVKKAKQCYFCGKGQYEIEFTKPTVFHEITESGGATRLLPVAIRERLERITADDLKLLGYDPSSARPEWLILQVLPVPPVAVRPSITLESGIRSEDDLTHKIVDILRVNQRVRESKESGTPPLIVQDLVDLLQYHVTTYFDNEVSGIPQAHHRSGRPLKTISQRLKGKEGRFRGSLSGKRVDFSSRTVISPDPSLDISEVGIPFEVARKLTIPEKASPWNLEFLKKLIINGPFKHPGANYIIRPDGIKIRLDYVTDLQMHADSLAPGFIVERHLTDGDIVIFNRQPSLHRMSVMAHYVKVLPYRTFRLHPAVCPPYNSDFDGDEMNLHVPQSEEARSEALTLMRVQDQILSPRYGGPIIGGIRDFLTAAYLLTKEGVYLTKEEFTNLAMAGGFPPEKELPKPEKTDPQPLYTGRQLFSLFLPQDFNYVLVSKWEKSSRGAGKDVVIKNGTLLSGVIDRAAIGAEESDSILHRIAKDYGTDEARNFLNSILRLLKAFITRSGFSYGFDELELPQEVRAKISETLDESYAKVKDLNTQYRNGTLPETRGLSPEDALEFYVANELSRARERAGRIADKSFSPQNAGIIMARTGARGSTLNLGQMTAALGQQSVRGKRIEKGYLNRALPHFSQNDPSPDARGFVRSNYRDGLNPIEFFFHAMGGREGLVDTAVRTQQSGYMQRRLVNALEHLKVEYDLTVRDPNGNVIQFKYGEDGIDPAKSDHGRAVNLERLIDTTALSSDASRAAAESTIERAVEKYSERLNPRLRKDLLEALKGSKLDPKSVEKVCERVVELVTKGTVEPGEASGIVAAQSIGEPGTQMSIAADERVVVQENGRVKAVKISDFVDGLMGVHPVSKEGDAEWCDLPSETRIQVPSLGAEGKIHWKPLQSVSRHHHHRPLIRIKTRSGRTITATDNHSFVTRIDGKLVPILGRDLTTGDRIPVVKHLPIGASFETHLDAAQVLPQSSHWFASEVAKAQGLGRKWHAGYGTDYEVPVKRDELRNVLTGRSQLVMQDGLVHPYQIHGNASLPETVKLDESMGWLVGAFLSEGCSQQNHVSLSNADEGFLERARSVSKLMGMKFHVIDNTNGFAPSQDIIIHSSILSEFLSKSCGKTSKEKHIPNFALGASDDFVLGLLRAYFDGDGHIDVKRFAIRASSRSKELIDGISLLLSRFGIFASKTSDGKSFALWIPARSAAVFKEKIGTDIEYKSQALEILCKPQAKGYTDDTLDTTSGFGRILYDLARELGIPTRRVNNFTKRQHIGRTTLARYVEIFERRASELGKDVSSELASLRTLLEEDVTWDEILAIERVQPSDDRVYDFSVPGLETFVTAECVVTHNTLRTFHFAGVKERDVTLGLPRLIELVDARKQPATPSMDVFLDEDSKKSNEKAIKVANLIRFTKVVSVVDKAEVDPSGAIYLFIGKEKLAERQCSIKDIVTAIESPKREVSVDEKRNVVTIKIDVDYASLHIHKNKILNQKVKGIPGIDRVTVVKEGDEWKIQTSGSNLQKVRQIEGVDKSRTTTNNIFEIYQALGIEAARSALVREIIGTLEEQGLEVDIRHIYLVADLMTSKGFLQQIGRHGVAGTKTSVLARAAFEITVPTLAEAAVRGETEELRGVTENVIVGLPIPVGTGMIDVFMRGV